MSAQQRIDYILALDDEYLRGGVVLSEWTAFMVREADNAFVAACDLACVLTVSAAIETALRSETGVARLVEGIETSAMPAALRAELHDLRRFRNRWVHIQNPADDSLPLDDPMGLAREVHDWAVTAVRLLRRVIYLDQCM
jgi:hypothetical protein